MNAPSALRGLGPAAAVTTGVLLVLAIGIAAGGTLAWLTVTNDPNATARTIGGAVAIVDLIWIAHFGHRLVRAYRRHP